MDAQLTSDDPRYRGRNRIIVTGIGGRLGRLFVRRLHREFDGKIVGIDRRECPGLPRDIEHARVDIRSKRARDIFRGNDVLALVHLGVMHNPRQPQKEHHSWNVQGTQRLLDACVAYNVPKVVVLSSANVYGPHPDNPQFLPEDAPLMAAADFPAIRDLIEVDMLASSYFWKVQACDTVILRPVHILGQVKKRAIELPAVAVRADVARLRSDAADHSSRRCGRSRDVRVEAAFARHFQHHGGRAKCRSPQF